MTGDRDRGAATLLRELWSGQPEQVRAALRELPNRWPHPDDVPIPLPPADILVKVGDRVPEDVVLAYLDALWHGSFTPVPPPAEVIKNMARVLLRYGTDRAVSEVADELSTGFDPIGAVRDALQQIGLQGATDAAEARVAERLVELLLRHDELRPTVVEALAEWRDYLSPQPLLDPVLPLLTDAEARKVTGSDQSPAD
jgi:hypothetical protein